MLITFPVILSCEPSRSISHIFANSYPPSPIWTKASDTFKTVQLVEFFRTNTSIISMKALTVILLNLCLKIIYIHIYT